jgi:hypothetical protein
VGIAKLGVPKNTIFIGGWLVLLISYDLGITQIKRRLTPVDSTTKLHATIGLLDGINKYPPRLSFLLCITFVLFLAHTKLLAQHLKSHQ